ncbi:MAG: purine-nucleoside phosphorylase [Malacoplasma sp.]|nr:purine-nucleoside phosphorylase [Malacoplasma sp.]MDE5841626.1 purine-nucleoside phosphorylase [Malacoplasma sp.]MDE6082388.1 purine-nucleoside phosphorylase [Malacoplasma sp.]MDE6429490.1 purine-nucleoside phosphorylase [Malacoplasma sp.]MDE6562672.1 purine-nucleoside phosphorylase [Malacoplasma sp.]
MTPHNTAKKEDIAKVVLMPGDPLRAKWMAENFLTNIKLVNEVRGMLAFTGEYKNKKITIMGHGMGIPSIGIYSYELFHFYDVDAIIRVGSAGSYSKNINVGDLILTKEAYSESTFAKLIGVEAPNNVLLGNNSLNELIKKTASENNILLKEARIHSSDIFYGSKRNLDQIIADTKAEAVEMESFALFANAIKLNKKAATLLTCSDSLVTHESMSAHDRQTKFVSMIDLALKTILKI